MTPEQQAALLKPFPPTQIQQLPKGGAKLDYVSHAYVTQRLLEVDPEWTWAPAGQDANGLPKLDDENGLWIYLTVGGVTRLGYGEASGGYSHADKVKSAIGDAIRNAAMRFGVALSLWQHDVPSDGPVPSSDSPGKPLLNHQASDGQIKRIKAMLLQAGYTGDLANQASVLTGQDIKFEDLTSQQAKWVMDKLEKVLNES